ncbi:MAG TPA: hypothetical protein VK718_00325 [Ferruginibacter sp.]|jgi:hypothetical protein|nr:hypothetical protein [Ferruginibacter sp.]
MKKIFPLFVISLVFAIMFVSCKKTVTTTVTIKDTIRRESIVGFWPGLYEQPGYDPLDNTLQFSFLYRNDGTMRVYADGTDTTSADVGEEADGTYNISGLTLTTYFNIGGTDFISAATLDSTFTYYEGTAGDAPSSSGFVVFIGNKQ